jgi:hypothetical protein
MIKTQVTGGGRKYITEISKYNALSVSQIIPDILPNGTENRYRFFNKIVGSTGADSGTTSMNVDGSGTSQEFYIEASQDYDIYITRVTILIADTAIVHSAFGNISALGTGWDLYTQESGEVTYLLEKAKTGGQIIARSGLFMPYGDGTTAWELSNWTGTADAQTILLPLSDYVPGGVRLGRGTRDRIVSTVNDDLTGLTEFEVRAFGYRHYP